MKKILLIAFYFSMHNAISQGNCSAKFWTISSNGQKIREWCFENQNITGGDFILTVPNGLTRSLAYCSDGHINTFFCFGNSTNVQKFDGISQWVDIPVGTIGFDNGGYGIHQYFRDYNFNLYYYDGINTSIIATDIYMTVADVAVDSQGRAWVFTADTYPTNVVDSLKVYDKNNGLVVSYALNFDSLNSYGSFFINDKLYFLKGEYATTNPNSITPVNIVNGNAELGEPISFICGGCADAASANFDLLSVEDFSTDKSIIIYPNPANQQININSNLTILEVLIYDLNGRLMKTIKSERSIDISMLENQIYILKIVTSNGVINKLFEKKK